jgi:hypothetical protein
MDLMLPEESRADFFAIASHSMFDTIAAATKVSAGCTARRFAG